MKKFIGNKDFYKLVAALALPLLLQNAVSTFVNLLDNLMVGRIGTESMSGVSIVNQLLFVYNLCLFGGTGGFALGEHGHADGLARAVRQAHGAAELLIGLTGVDAQAEVRLHRLVELRERDLLHEGHGLEGGAGLLADLLESGAIVLGKLRHGSSFRGE